MRDNEYLEWEREQYLRSKYRGKRHRKAKLICAIIAAIIAIALVTLAVSAEDKPVKHERVVMPEIDPVEVQVIEPEPMEHLGEFKITHYCACKKCCGKWADGVTATGTTATEGRTIAVDPSVIPFGSEVAVFYDDGRICYYSAEDSGSEIKGNEIDVFVDDHSRANELGVIGASVYLVNEEG